MPLVTLDAIILQAFPYSETSKILRLLTPSHGVQSVIAKGARRTRSRYGGVLEPFTDGHATFYLRENRDLHTLSGFELSRPRQALGRDLVRFGAASLLAEIVLRTASGQDAPELFGRVRTALTLLEHADEERIEVVALAQSWALITVLGFGPSLDRCVGCGSPMEGDRDRFLDYGAGGLYCGDCGAVGSAAGPGGAPGIAGGGGGGRVLPDRARRDLMALCAGEPVAVDRTGAHWQLLARFLGYHLVDAGSLRSLEFLSEAVGAR